MTTAGYLHLIERFGLACLRPAAPVRVDAVTRIIRGEDAVLVPPQVAPGANASAVEHLLFALRHEGIDLAIIDALAHSGAVDDRQVREAIEAKPAGAYARKLGFLWELVTGRALEGVAARGGAYVGLFDPDHYYTGNDPLRNTKWRVDFNGLGVPGYCPVIRKTPEMIRLLGRDLFIEVDLFAEQAREAGILERILSWAYLDETRHSFAIEREAAPADRAEAFAAVLQNAHDARPIDEQYLVELQNILITNPLGREAGYRNEQNWLGRAGRGATSVRYVPPGPDALHPLMSAFTGLCNRPRSSNALLHAALCSFGFVYLHPFMDGNGRLSRFLFHHALCAAKSLPDGLILPVSIALHRNERAYLQALETFSKPARQLWDVRWIDGDRFTFTQRCRDSVYRYWDATAQAAFSVRMAGEAMDVHLVGEANWLSSFDAAYRALDRKLDLPSPVLHKLIVMCESNGGNLSANRRKQFKDQVPADYFDQIEREVAAAFELSSDKAGRTDTGPGG